MKTLIVAATHAEIDGFLNHYKLDHQTFVNNGRFDVLVTGVGMTATAFALGRYLNQSHQLLLNVGIAGAFDRSLQLGALVNVRQDCLAELGAEDHDNFLSINELGFGENRFFAASSLVLDLKEVIGITVNKVHGRSESIQRTLERFNPAVESMEGAAVFYACDQLKVPALQIRSISNYVEPRNRENWKIGLAIQQLNQWLINFAEQQLSNL